MLTEMMGIPRYPTGSQNPSISCQCEAGIFLENSAYNAHKSERGKGYSSLIDLNQKIENVEIAKIRRENVDLSC
jgi:hypothetical protein